MKQKYVNEMLGQSKPELKEEWESLWNRLVSLDPVKDYQELVELNKRFDKCVEAYYAVDCGDYWEVRSGTGVKKNNRTFKVMKESV